MGFFWSAPAATGGGSADAYDCSGDGTSGIALSDGIGGTMVG
jgi:hypothetical protein